MTGQQLDCFTFTPAESSDTVADAAAPVSSPTGASADGSIAAAAAMQQSHAAKQDLGDTEDAAIGMPPFLFVLQGHLNTVALILA